MDVLHRASLPTVRDANEGSESSSFSDDSDDSTMFSSADLSDDATSTSPSSTTCNVPQGPLYQLSSLMDELPIKRGLSKYFQGKSESFTSLSDAKCIADLRKKSPCMKRMKTCRSYKEESDASTRPCYTPGLYSKTITKKPSGGSCSLLARRSSNSPLLYSRKTTHLPLHKNP